MSDETGWFGRIPARPREAGLTAAALLLIAVPLSLASWHERSCGRMLLLLPLVDFLGGATVFGLSRFIPTRGLGCLAMILAFPLALGIYVCMGHEL
jgi:hypothetical protein